MAGVKPDHIMDEIPLETIPEPTNEVDISSQSVDEKIVEADIVQVNQGKVTQVNAGKVEMQQGGAGRIHAEQATIHQGGVGMVQATSVNVSQSGIGIVRTGEAILERNTVQMMIAQKTTVNGGSTGLLVAQEVHANPLHAFVVLAGKTDGQIETTLDTHGAILAGLIAGIACGLVSLVGRLLLQRRR